MTSYLLTSPLYKKCSVLTFFSIKLAIEWAVWELSTITFKVFEKNQWERVFEKSLAFSRLHSIFNLKLILSSQKIGESKWGAISRLGHTFVFPIVAAPSLDDLIQTIKLLWMVKFSEKIWVLYYSGGFSRATL